MGKITIRDVAKHAGVSVATVSNVLNNINKASEETRQAVLQTIKELDYQPNLTARSLSTKKSNLIGVMIPLVERLSISTNPFYSEFVSGVEYSARQKGYDVLLTGLTKDQSCKEWVNKRNLDTIIFLGICNQPLLEELKSLHVPVVLTDTFVDSNLFYKIEIDDEYGGYIATKHLIELGHRHIAMIVPEVRYSGVNLMRFKGYKKALAEANIPLNEKLIFSEGIETSWQGGYKLGEQILNSEEEITAVFAVADILAFGLMKYLKQMDKKIPEDYSIVGFDDLEFCNYASPGLTTVRQDIFSKGVAATEAAIGIIEEKDNNKCTKTVLPLELIIRESTKKI